MQERHTNRKQYFEEQSLTTEKYIIPYINSVFKITAGMVVAEIGCGEAGNLKPFLNMECRVIGIDISKSRIENATKYYDDHPMKSNIILIAEDIYNVAHESLEKFDLIIMRDTLEHIPDQDKFLSHIRNFLSSRGKIFFNFSSVENAFWWASASLQE